MTAATRALVRERAGNHCEYCRIHQEDSPLDALHIEHIRPLKHGGSDEESNLCLACIDCNLHKGPNLTGIDPLTDAVTPLFHPVSNIGTCIFAGMISISSVKSMWAGRRYAFSA